MEESFPKAVKVENIANILKVTFENGEVKYVKSHWTEEITDALQFGKKGRGKRKVPVPLMKMIIQHKSVHNIRRNQLC